MSTQVGRLKHKGSNMLKKQDMTPGRVIVVDKPRSGLPKVMFGDDSMSESPDPEFVTVHKGFFEVGGGGWACYPGEQLEIIERPKRRHSVNGAKVKIMSNGEVGWAYWCELRASCKLA